MASKENIYSSIQNLYNMDKNTWQEVLAEFYNLIYDTQLKFEQVETKFTTLLGEEVTQALKEMYDNGLLGELISDINTNVENFKVEVNDKVENFKLEVNEQLDTMVKLTSSNTATQNKELIQNKINSFKNVDIKGACGEYEIDNSILLRSNVTLKLNDSIIIKNSATATSNIITKASDVDRLYSTSIYGGTFDYNLLQTSNNNLHAIFLHKGNTIKLKDITVINARKYAIFLADMDKVTVENIKFNTASDGIHFQPPLKSIYLNDIKGTTRDDMVAITIGDYASYNTSQGDVEDFYASNIYPNNSMTALKLCGAEGYRFKNVVMENVYGTTFHQGFFFQTDGDILNDFTADYIRLSNIKVQTGGYDYPLLKLWTNKQMNIDTLILENVEHDGNLLDIRSTNSMPINIKNLYIRNVDLKASDTENILKYFMYLDTAVTIENLYLENINVDSDNIKTTGFESIMETRATVNNLYINNCNVKLPVNTYRFIKNQNGTINNIFIRNLNQDGGANIYYQNSSIGTCNIILDNIISNAWEAFNINANTLITANNFISVRDGAIFRFNNENNTYKINGIFLNLTTPSRDIVAGASVGTILRNGSNNANWT